MKRSAILRDKGAATRATGIAIAQAVTQPPIHMPTKPACGPTARSVETPETTKEHANGKHQHHKAKGKARASEK